MGKLPNIHVSRLLECSCIQNSVSPELFSAIFSVFIENPVVNISGKIIKSTGSKD